MADLITYVALAVLGTVALAAVMLAWRLDIRADRERRLRLHATAELRRQLRVLREDLAAADYRAATGEACAMTAPIRRYDNPTLAELVAQTQRIDRANGSQS